MRVFLLILLLVILLIGSIAIVRKFKLHLYGKIGIVLVGICLWIMIGYLININTISSDLRKKIAEVEEICGSDYIRQDGSSIYINVQGKWVDLENVEILGDFSKDLYLEYDNTKVYVGHSGLYNTLKTLSSLGIIELN